MSDLGQLTAWRDALLSARYRGIRTVEVDGRRVEYRSDAELAAALSDLERRIQASQSSRITMVRISSSKGV